MSQDVPGATAGPRPRPARRRRRILWRATGVVVAGAIGATAIAANFVHVPYVIISPGEATALDGKVVSISGARTYRHAGDVLYLTVRVSNQDPSLWRYLLAELDDDVTIEKKEDVISCASYDENTRLNNLLMRVSQDTAKTVALEHLGYQVVHGANRVVIVNVQCDGPSNHRLMLGDVITAIDGKPASSAEEVRPLVQSHRPGDELRVSVERGGKARQVAVRLGVNHGAAYLGIATQSVSESKFPFDVRIDTRRVSGPSAGLAFTLAVIDDLTPGELTGGRRVAVTGSILPDGRVAPVGGVEQKAVTAQRDGVRLMLVPADEVKDARNHAGSMRVVAVRTLDDALAALARAGGDPLPASPAANPGQ